MVNCGGWFFDGVLLQARRASRLAEMHAVDLQATEANKNTGAVEEERQSASKASSEFVHNDGNLCQASSWQHACNVRLKPFHLDSAIVALFEARSDLASRSQLLQVAVLNAGRHFGTLCKQPFPKSDSTQQQLHTESTCLACCLLIA